MAAIVQLFQEEVLGVALKFAKGRRDPLSNASVVITKDDMELALKYLDLIEEGSVY